MNLKHMISSVFKLYGLRNAMYMRGDSRLLFLLNSVRVLAKHIRKETKDKKVLADALASVFSRACSYADSFVDLEIVEALSEKYPKDRCAYCGRLPCMCASNRTTELVCAPVDGSQDDWSVRDWCDHIDKVYGDNNRARGIQFAIGRLYEEICEAVDTQFLDTNNPSLDLDEVRRRMSHEFADVFAWIFTLCVLLEVDIEPVLEERYGGVCNRCQARPCSCGHFSVNYLSGTEEMRVRSIIAH